MSRERDPAKDALHEVVPQKDPWRTAPVIVAQIPDAGLHRDLDADSATRHAIAEVAGIREVVSAQAAFDLTLQRDGKVHVTGWVRARIGQDCVVTLDPIENEIHEPIDLIFAPPDQIPDMADLVEDDLDEAVEIPDPPEPIINGQIDLGRVAVDALFLAIDPYPRKPGVEFEAEIVAANPEDHPFAALRALKPRGDKA
jgi:uncharacterized protein DUF177 involved in 23S rRNA accumulation